jgi:major vault protein
VELEDYIIIPPKSYCIILNPVERDESNNAVFDEHGMCKLKFGDKEVRLEQTPFPLYPGEEVLESVQKLKVVKKDRALRLTTNENFTEQDGTERVAGDEWIFEGPATYLPRKEVSIIE